MKQHENDRTKDVCMAVVVVYILRYRVQNAGTVY